MSMYECFYLTMLLSAIALGVVTLVGAGLGKLSTKVWRNIFIILTVITALAMVGFIVTLRM